MNIKEVNITNFGKLQNKKYSFSPGINVIYGPNEAGKTTLQQFMKSMLFGLEKKRGKSVQDEYQRYEPWGAPAYFAGSMIFETGGQKFLLERNFYHKEKRSRLVNMGDLEELSVEQGDLKMLLGNVSRSAYENTYCISQEKTVPGNDLGVMLSDEKSNLAQTNDAGFQLSKALERLAEKKRSFEKQKKELEQIRLREIGRLQMQEQILANELEHLQEKLQENRVAKEKQKAVLQDTDRMMLEKQKMDDHAQARIKEKKDERAEARIKWNPCIIIGCAGFILISSFANVLPVSSTVYHVLQLIFAALVVLGLMQAMKKKKRDMSADGTQTETRPEPGESHQLQEQRRQMERTLHQLQAAEDVILQEMQEKEVQRANLVTQQEELQLESVQERQADGNKNAVALAADTLQRLAHELAEESNDSLNERMSEIVSQITAGRYDALSLDDGQKLIVTDQIHMRRPEVYSQATMQQMYFAYRMAAGEMLTREEMLPLMFDEAFAGYDEERLKAVLQWLAKQKKQVFLFTSRHLEAEILQAEGIIHTEICI